LYLCSPHNSTGEKDGFLFHYQIKSHLLPQLDEWTAKSNKLYYKYQHLKNITLDTLLAPQQKESYLWEIF
jgi:hypothetical protein